MSKQKIIEREAFEAALVEWWPQAKGNLNFEDGGYSNHLMNYAWWGWQASQKQRAGSHDVAESNSRWKLVPIEPTREMREAFHTAHDEAESGDFRVYSPDHEWQAMLAAAPEVMP